MATILLGSNDAVSSSLDKRHTPIRVYKKCLEKIIEELRGRGIDQIVLISPPPVDVKKWRAYAFTTFGLFCLFNTLYVATHYEIL